MPAAMTYQYPIVAEYLDRVETHGVFKVCYGQVQVCEDYEQGQVS